MEQATYFSATSMPAPKRRAMVFVILFAWLALLLTCPTEMDGGSNLASADKEHVSHTTTGSTHDTSHDDLCCTTAQHTAVLATAQKFNLTAFLTLISVPPVIVMSLIILVAATTNRGFLRSSRSSWTKNSPLFRTLWPQAPPH
ncbi:hypothetical protein [Sulfuricaulis limicola]|nr:hypothetical protein [Sulfuricaulis limicola]